MLHFQGDKEFPLAPAETWEKLSDPGFLVQCMPDVQSVSQANKEAAAWVVRPGFSFVRGTLDMTMQILEAIPSQSVRVAVQSKGIGSSSTVEAALNFAASGNATRVHWSAEVKELGGLLKAVPKGLIQAAADKVIADVWKAIEAKLH